MKIRNRFLAADAGEGAARLATLDGLGQGPAVHRLLASGGDVSVLRTLDILRKDEWELTDDTVYEVAQRRLKAAADLISRNLTFNVPNGLAVPVLHWQTVGDMNDAQVDMSGITPGQNDRPDFASKYLPLPIVHKDFQINIRVLLASRRAGIPLDTTGANAAARKVAEKVDDVIVNGASITAGGGSVYGYTTHPNRNTGSLTGAWTGLTGAQILVDVQAMIQDAIDDRYDGPFVLYVPRAYSMALEANYATAYPGSIRARLLEIDGLEAIETLDELAAGNVVLVTMRPDVIQLVTGMEPTTVSWEEMGGMITLFKVMAIMVPRIHVDPDGRSGIVHYTV